MCGIAGILGSVKKRESIIQKMLHSIKYRGPDESGYFKDERIILGHLRLSIIGVENGQQPIYNENKSIVVIVNGEIYNYQALADELRSKGHIIEEGCDSFVIPHLYEEYGKDLFKKINGQFAIAIWDIKKEELILARDRFGEKPLYYRDVNGIMYFCSEIEPLIKVSKKNTVNNKCLKDICTTWVPLGNHTLYEDIFGVESGSYIAFCEGEMNKAKYFELSFKTDCLERKSIDEHVNELDILLNKSVKNRMISDVPISFYLSGGLDSSLITAIATKYSKEKLNTFSIAFKDNAYDESQFQKIMANKLNTNHHQLTVSNSDISSCFEQVLYHTETPLMRLGSLPMYRLSEFVHKKGYKVVLSGEGADEVFGGYDIFKEAKIRAFCEKDKDSKLRPLLYKRTNSYIKNFGQMNSAALATFFGQVKSNDLFSSHLIRFRFGSYCSQFFDGNVKLELKDYMVKEELAKILHKDYHEFSNVSKAQYIEIKTFFTNYLLSSQGDRVSMANSVEGRYPFLDNDVVEFACRLNDKYKLHGLKEKYILKKLADRYLPKEIVQRVKFPYRVPVNMKELMKNKIISDSISENSINRYKIFNNVAVAKFINKIKLKESITEKESMLLLFIVSTQMLLLHNLSTEGLG